MAYRKWSRRQLTEKPKDHAALPDTLDTGYFEERDGVDGQLFVYVRKQPAAYVVLGKYLREQKDGSLYYVSDFTMSPLFADRTYKFDHLLLAIAQVHEIIERFEERTKDEDVHG